MSAGEKLRVRLIARKQEATAYRFEHPRMHTEQNNNYPHP